MDDIPSISSGTVGSRFVSQAELETAKQRRDEQWKAAYARLGQEPPPQPAEDVFDGRSLAEKLAANKAAKQEEWEARNKLGNQFRALEEDEVIFLDSVLEKQREEEREREKKDGEELKNFREAVAARENAAKPPPMRTTPSAASTPMIKPPALAPKKESKKSLKGVLVKKKSKTVTSTSPNTSKDVPAPSSKVSTSKDNSGDVVKTDKEDEPEPHAKRRKISTSDTT